MTEDEKASLAIYLKFIRRQLQVANPAVFIFCFLRNLR